MQVLAHVSEILIPVIIFYIVGYGVISKIKVYEEFITGAKEGLKTVVNIMPTLIGLMVAVGVLRASGFMDIFGYAFGGIAKSLGIEADVVPLIFVKMFSSSAATGLVLDLFGKYGTDSMTGSFISILMSCTETIFYTLSVYCIAGKITKTKWTLPGALLTTAVGVVMAYVLAGKM